MEGLTGESEQKYVPEKVYALSKDDLEQLYEQAKSVVLQQFCTNEEFKRRLIDSSIIDASENCNNSTSKPITEINNSAKITREHESIVPTLNLPSSPEPRDNVISDTDPGYYFSNSLIESNIEPSSDHQQPEQIKSNTETVVEAIDSGATTQNLDDSQIHTEEQMEKDDHSTSYQDDIQSDITEDSLNKPLHFTNENSSEIRTVPENESHVNESDRSSQIPLAIENEGEALTQNMNSSSNKQLIEETSFPEMNIEMTISSIAEDVSAVNLSSSEGQNYTNDNFEDKSNTADVTTNSTTTVTKIATSSPPTATATMNQTSDSGKSIDQFSTLNNEHPKELEQRLILIGDGLRELSEAISQSPVLQSDRESGQHTNEFDDSEKLADSMSPVSDSNNKSNENDKSSTESFEASENHSENEIATESSTAATKSEPSMEHPTVESDESTDSIAAEIAVSNTDHHQLAETIATKRPFQYTLSGGSIDYNKVPEADALKRAPAPSETEVLYSYILIRHNLFFNF